MSETFEGMRLSIKPLRPPLTARTPPLTVSGSALSIVNTVVVPVEYSIVTSGVMSGMQTRSVSRLGTRSWLLESSQFAAECHEESPAEPVQVTVQTEAGAAGLAMMEPTRTRAEIRVRLPPRTRGWMSIRG
jgi:hypothetical protein